MRKSLSASRSREIIGIGDFIQYRFLFKTAWVRGADTVVTDIFPKGFRYQSGSLRNDGELKLTIPPLLMTADYAYKFALRFRSSETIVTYVTEVTPVAEIGEARNLATVTGDSGLI